MKRRETVAQLDMQQEQISNGYAFAGRHYWGMTTEDIADLLANDLSEEDRIVYEFYEEIDDIL